MELNTNLIKELREMERYHYNSENGDATPVDNLLSAVAKLPKTADADLKPVEFGRSLAECKQFLEERGLYVAPTPLVAVLNQKDNSQSDNGPTKAQSTGQNSDGKPGMPAPKDYGGLSGDRKKQSMWITLLTPSDFNAVPKYMKGRLTISDVNRIATHLNGLLEAKYKLMDQTFLRLSKPNKDKVIRYREQENDDTSGRRFVLESDLKDSLANSKRDAALIKNILPILRHCHRIQEIRGNKLVRLATIE